MEHNGAPSHSSSSSQHPGTNTHPHTNGYYYSVPYGNMLVHHGAPPHYAGIPHGPQSSSAETARAQPTSHPQSAGSNSSHTIQQQHAIIQFGKQAHTLNTTTGPMYYTYGGTQANLPSGPPPQMAAPDPKHGIYHQTYISTSQPPTGAPTGQSYFYHNQHHPPPPSDHSQHQQHPQPGPNHMTAVGLNNSHANGDSRVGGQQLNNTGVKIDNNARPQHPQAHQQPPPTQPGYNFQQHYPSRVVTKDDHSSSSNSPNQHLMGQQHLHVPQQQQPHQQQPSEQGYMPNQQNSAAPSPATLPSANSSKPAANVHDGMPHQQQQQQQHQQNYVISHQNGHHGPPPPGMPYPQYVPANPGPWPTTIYNMPAMIHHPSHNIQQPPAPAPPMNGPPMQTLPPGIPSTVAYLTTGMPPPPPPMPAYYHHGTGHPPPPQPAAEHQSPRYVNAKQYRRILKRREARAKLEEIRQRHNTLRTSTTSPRNAHSPVPPSGASSVGDGGSTGGGDGSRKPYMHESRHRHAMKRPRGPKGRFLTKVSLGLLFQNLWFTCTIFLNFLNFKPLIRMSSLNIINNILTKSRIESKSWTELVASSEFV